MWYDKFIKFLKQHNLYDEEVINYWKENNTQFDYRDKDERCFVGCYYTCCNDRVAKVTVIVPFIVDDETLLINIHEYVHFYILCKNIGKKYNPGFDKEILPVLFEKEYINENQTDELLAYYQYLKSFILENKNDEYALAYLVSEDLLSEGYNSNFTKLEKKSRRLARKYYKK